MMDDKDTLDFIIIGAQKSGTSSLFQYLRHHPELFIPVDKEVPYFSHDTVVETIPWRTYIERVSRNVERDALRKTADPALKWGTATPHYMLGTSTSGSGAENGSDERTVPLRIKDRLPDARLIAILRDPVARAVSHHRMISARGQERRTFDDAIDELLRPDSLQRARRHADESTGYVVRGEYGRILSGYFDVFAPEQILVVFTDELDRAPAALLRRIHQFIGVSPDFTPGNLGATYNVGGTARQFSWGEPSSWLSPSSPLSPQGLRRAVSRNPAARNVWRTIPEERRRRLKRRYERMASRSARRNRLAPSDQAQPLPEPSPLTLQRLREHYAQDGDRLAELIGASPPWPRPAPAEISGR
jgi:hypothetical protein